MNVAEDTITYSDIKKWLTNTSVQIRVNENPSDLIAKQRSGSGEQAEQVGVTLITVNLLSTKAQLAAER